ncbi:helix-turn-helix domain-containing protein [Knoellia locipacati]|uniref:ArsR/SmtB family transcription factor n=1 Tax=Knoellia locipacati TaxID=882824 RepID=UPI00384C593C
MTRDERPPAPSGPMPPDGVRTITDAKALSAMANPFRSRMMDALKVDGPSTASGLAARTGQAVGSASHHLKVLSEAGLVEEAPELAKDRRERWWRLVDPGTRWSRGDFASDTAAVTAAYAAEALALQRQFERVQEWNANAATVPEWDDAAFATQNWMRLTPDEMREMAVEIVEVLVRWSRREVPDDGEERESVFVFSRGFPAQP